jgi:glutamate-ammonia-ligase adenylyltransferase
MEVTFSFDFSHLPAPAATDRLALGRKDWLEAASEEENQDISGFMREIEASPQGGRLLDSLVGNSPFLAQAALREPALLNETLEKGPDSAWHELVQAAIAQFSHEEDTGRLMTGLRRLKRRAALLIAVADLAGVWRLEQVTQALSSLADLATDMACAHLLRQAHAAGEIVLPHPKEPCRESGLIIIGMGKWGACELNYSSDIDLIVIYDADRIDYKGQAGIGTFMVRLTRNLVRLLDERTGDGYVFRTDLRLRPDPGSTPLAIALAAAETYYEAFGQNWERAAMIKARAVAGDLAAGESFLKTLRPFIWRKNLDFAAIQDIHSIKRQINAHRGGEQIAVLGHNIKLGRGGIREIEFFAQTQQLIWGGRLPALRLRATCQALDALVEAGQVLPEVARDMKDAYRFLRTLEHRLQMIDDKQTQTLPAAEDKLGQIAIFMGYKGGQPFRADLLKWLRVVENHYAKLFEDQPGLGASEGSLIFTGSENDPETLATLARMGFGNTDAVCSTIRGWHHGRIRATRSTRARELLTELTPALLAALAKSAHPDAAFLKFDEFLARLPAGVQLFSLFAANPPLLDLVGEIMGTAPRLADHLSRSPTLLDNVLTQGFFETPPGAQEQRQDLAALLEHAQDSHFEEALDLVRRWANDQKFRIGVLMLKGKINPEEAGRAFAAVAESVLANLMPLIVGEHERAHGAFPAAELVVVAMGKMGGREMTATSDLDLILIYDVPADAEASNGARPMPPSSYYGRITQRLVNALTALSPEGRLYEVDMRLRPSGRAGPLAASLDSFTRYHREDAWTWEYQALTRARPVAGPESLQARIEEVIREALTRERDPLKLKADVADMRQRMAKEHKGLSPWDIKHRRGGLVDIEFMAQYLQLLHAPRHPDVLSTNTAEALGRLSAMGLLDASAFASLAQALRLWTAVQGVLRLTIAEGFSEAEASAGLTAILAQAGGAVDFAALKTQMESSAAAVAALFDGLLGQMDKTKEGIAP